MLVISAGCLNLCATSDQVALYGNLPAGDAALAVWPAGTRFHALEGRCAAAPAVWHHCAHGGRQREQAAAVAGMDGLAGEWSVQ